MKTIAILSAASVIAIVALSSPAHATGGCDGVGNCNTDNHVTNRGGRGGNGIGIGKGGDATARANAAADVRSRTGDVTTGPTTVNDGPVNVDNREKTENNVYVPPANALSNAVSPISCKAVISQSLSGVMAGIAVSWTETDEQCDLRAASALLYTVTGSMQVAIGPLCLIPSARAALATFSTEYDVRCADVLQSASTYDSQH